MEMCDSEKLLVTLHPVFVVLGEAGWWVGGRGPRRPPLSVKGTAVTPLSMQGWL